jgi:amidase
MTASCRSFWFYLPLAFATVTSFSGCTLFPKLSANGPGKRAFIKYWPSQENTGKLRVAVKDNIDMKGVVTTAGSQYFVLEGKPAAQDAPCLEIARERDVDFVGKTNLSEFAVAPSGFNGYFGTPRSPLSSKRRLIPGGSSCGAAVAVALGLADVAIGTDTAGSVRVPAACSGVVGLKTTFGLVSTEGVHPIEPKHLDTVGPLGKDIAHTAKGMDLLERGFATKYANAVASQPNASGIRIGRLRVAGTDPRIDAAVDAALTKAGFRVVQLDETFRQKWNQATRDGNTLAAAGAWISNQQYRRKYGISGRTKSAILAGRIAYNRGYQAAVARQEAWQEALGDVFEKVDFIALPTINATPPAIPINLRIGVLEAVVLSLQNTVAVNYAGNPALAVPVPAADEDVPVTSLQLVGPRRSEAALLNAGRLIEKAVKGSS